MDTKFPIHSRAMTALENEEFLALADNELETASNSDIELTKETNTTLMKHKYYSKAAQQLTDVKNS